MLSIVEKLRRGVTWSDGKPIEAVVGAVNDPVMAEAADIIEAMHEALTEAQHELIEHAGGNQYLLAKIDAILSKVKP